MKLDLEYTPVYIVDWLTYSHQTEKGLTSLGQFIADKVGYPNEIQITECGNDTQYLIDATGPKSAFDIKEATKVLDKIKKKGYVEVYKLRYVLLACCIEKWIPAGQYVVKVSW